MARVTVRADDYEDGVLPQVCVATGERAEVLVEHHSRTGAGAWSLLLLLLGPLGFVAMVVVDRLLHAEAEGLVPLSRAALAEAKARRRRWNGAALVALVGAVAVTALGLALPALRPEAWLAAVAGVVAAVVCWLMPAQLGVTGRPDQRGRAVTLSGASPAFVRAYRSQEAARAEARRRSSGVGTTAPGPG